jgi:cobalamin biosynthetic protein CobC
MSMITHGGGLAAAAAIYGGNPEDWLDLSTGINPCPPPLPDIPLSVWNRLPDAHLAMATRLAAFHHYIGDALSEVDPGHLPLAVPGTQALIELLPGVVPPERPVAILSPTYGEYAHCFRKAGFLVDEIRDISEVSAVHALLVIVNPNNPDGRVLSPDILMNLRARMVAQGGHLHIDEAFGDLDPRMSLAGFAMDTIGLSVSRSFGKFFGMAGIRLGFVFAARDLLEAFEEKLGPWPVAGPTLYVGTQFLQHDRASVAIRIATRSASLRNVLETAGLKIAGDAGLFLLVEDRRAGDIFTHLAKARILVRKFDYNATWLRIGLAPDEANDRRLAEALADFK